MGAVTPLGNYLEETWLDRDVSCATVDADNDGTEELLIRYNNSDAACETYSFYLPVKAEKFYPFFNKTAVPTKGKLHFRVFSPLHPPVRFATISI